MPDIIKIRRGLKAALPTLALGEFGYCTDTKELYIGTGTGNDLIQDGAAEILAKLGISAISGTNTGDETASTIKTKLGISAISGVNTGDETASGIRSKLGISTLSGSNTGDETESTIKTKLGVTSVGQTNPNLLDNWDWRNPVKQYGINTWTAGYGIDRWFLSADNSSITINPGNGLDITNTLDSAV
jgi:hypothetical protein